MALNSIISAMHLATAEWTDQRVKHYRISAGDSTADATAYRRNLDYRVDVMLEGYQYTFGRNNGARWRRTPAGVVRIIRSDVQGDALDRWPSAVFGFSTTSLSIGNIGFKGTVAAYVASPLPTDLDIPLDGVVRTNVLGLFDWWFDYDRNRLWFKYRG